MAWQVQDAKARFSELLATSQTAGPQIVTKRGVATAVLVAMDEWLDLQHRARPGIKEWLLAPEGKDRGVDSPSVGTWTSLPAGVGLNQVFLLDTNVVSELRRPRPNPGVLQWIGGTPAHRMYLSAVTIGEIQAGIEICRENDPAKAEDLEKWLNQVLSSHRILLMDAEAFRVWARLQTQAAEVTLGGRHDRRHCASTWTHGRHAQCAGLSSTGGGCPGPVRRVRAASTHPIPAPVDSGSVVDSPRGRG